MEQEASCACNGARVATNTAPIYEWNWAGAEREFRRAIELNPNSAEAHGWLAAYLYSRGRRDEGKAECALAEAHDPVNYRGSGCYTEPGDEDRGIALLRSYLELSPEDGFAHYDLSELYARKGMQKEHVDEMERAATLFGFPEVANDMARNYATSGYQGALRTWAVALDKSGVNRPTMVAEAYVRLGDKDQAFQWLKRAYRERESGIVGLNADPEWASLRPTPDSRTWSVRWGCQSYSVPVHSFGMVANEWGCP